MNIVNEPYENFFEYMGPDNVLVIPITNYVKKSSGELSVVDPISKEAFEKFPFLPKRWGYLVSIGIPYPTYRSSDTILVGLPTREHYASKDDIEYIGGSLVYLADLAFEMPDKLFYLTPLAGNLETTIKYLDGTNNIVILNYEGTNSD